MLRDTILPQWHDASASGRHAGRKNHDGATEQLLELAVRQLQALTGRVVSYPPVPAQSQLTAGLMFCSFCDYLLVYALYLLGVFAD